jgi:hypothetical protein
MSDALSVFILEILKAVLPIVVPVVTAAIVGGLALLARRIDGWLQANLKAEQLTLLKAFVAETVKAIQQLADNGDISKLGADKKAEAIAVVQRWLDEHHVNGWSAASIEILIEGAIKDGVQKGTTTMIMTTPLAPPDGSPRPIPMPTIPPTRGSQPPR